MTGKKKIGLGTVQFGLPYGISNKEGQTSPYEVKKILEHAGDNEIEILDSASAYGNAEEVLGKNDLQAFKIVSKYIPPSAGEKIEDQFHKSLQNLRLASLYGYLAHRPMNLLEEPNEWEELKELKARGKVSKIGFSLNEPHELDLLIKKGFKPDLIQVPYNYFDRRFEEAMINLKSKGCEIHTRSSFLQGLFFLAPNKLNAFFDEIKPSLQRLQEMKGTLAGNLLNFVIEKPFIDKVIIGVENLQQLKKNLEDVEHSTILPEITENISENILIPSRWPQK